MTGIRQILSLLLLSGLLDSAIAQEKAGDALVVVEEQRTDDYAAQLEGHLRQWLVDDYPARAGEAWNRDYESVGAFLESVKPNRRRWRKVLKPLELSVTGDLQRRPHPPLAHRNGEWLTLPLGGLTAEGLLSVPAGAGAENPVPLVIAQHGIGSCPERTFGVLDEGEHYHRYSDAPLEAGFAVLAPMNLRGVERRNRIERLCRLADTSLPGIEFLTRWLLDETL